MNSKKITIAKLAAPALFLFLCTVGIAYSGQPANFLIRTILERFARNGFLVIALLIPITAGIGLNFSIVLGAMAAQIALIFIMDWGLSGTSGAFAAIALSTPIAIVFGWLVGQLFNKARGREMVTGLITGFFANGIYQLVFLFGAGSIIPILSNSLLLPRGLNPDGTQHLLGLRNTVDIGSVQYALDNLIPIAPVAGIPIPLFPLILIALACILVTAFHKTKLGQEMRAMGYNYHIAEVSGIPVLRNRLIATIISTVLAAWGQIIFLQNTGTINTYSSHEQVGMFSIAALLVSGATVAQASVWQALFGTLLFQILFITSPLAGKALFGEPMVGEYFRVFIAYGVIAVALALHAWQKKRDAKP